jgi:GH15 family glucan-1,4-alpha-glucosidase
LDSCPTGIPRVTGLVDAVQKELTEDGFVLRYRPESETTTDCQVMRACSLRVRSGWWKRIVGHWPAATEAIPKLFERLLALRNDVGLLSEEWDRPARSRQLGNTPQAFSHFALVTSALELHQDTVRRSDTPIPPETAETR